MRGFLILGSALSVVALAGCGNPNQLSGDVAALKQENADLKARVTLLEGKVEAITASLPDDSDLPDNDAGRSAN